MPLFAKDAFNILYPNEKVPEIFAGQMRIYDLAQVYNNTNFGKYAAALAKNQEKFAHYFEIAENGDVILQVNLKSGAKVI